MLGSFEVSALDIVVVTVIGLITFMVALIVTGRVIDSISKGVLAFCLATLAIILVPFALTH